MASGLSLPSFIQKSTAFSICVLQKANFSSHISEFEVLRLHVPTLSFGVRFCTKTKTAYPDKICAILRCASFTRQDLPTHLPIGLEQGSKEYQRLIMFAPERDILQIHEETTLTSLIEKHQRQWHVSKRHGWDYHVWSPVCSVVITMNYKAASTLVPLHVFFNNYSEKLCPKLPSFRLMWLVSLFFSKEGKCAAMSGAGVRTTQHHLPLLGFDSPLSTSYTQF